MAKRGPQSELNDRNWDDEEEAEEAGVFKQASADALKDRVIKKAKRRTAGEDGSGAKTSAFCGFGGLTAKIVPSALRGGAAAISPLDNNNSSKNDSSSLQKDNSSYLHDLKGLNESVLAWIKQHVDKNPYIILTPIFKDYEKYVANLKSKNSASSNNGNGTGSAFSPSAVRSINNGDDTKASKTADFSTFAPKKKTEDSDVMKDKDSEGTAKAPAFNFGSSNGEGFKFSNATATTTNSGFSFGKTSTTSVTSGFSFGSTSTAATPATGFSFGSSGAASTTTGTKSGFSFGELAAAKTASDNAQVAGGDDDEYVPPKPEVKEIKEEGSLFSKKCKLFYQKEGSWTERGVGNVHVKPLEGPKTQLLIRADTNLGNILLNINLTASLPVSRQGKNNVLLVCVPNPPLKDGDKDQKPISMLIRVKTADEADELLAKLNERKALL